jgi:hypothetical protein
MLWACSLISQGNNAGLLSSAYIDPAPIRRAASTFTYDIVEQAAALQEKDFQMQFRETLRLTEIADNGALAHRKGMSSPSNEVNNPLALKSQRH